MVSALTNTRLLASQMALQLLQSPDDTSQDDTTTSLLGDSSSGSDVSSLPSQSQASLTNLLNGISTGQTDTTDPTQSDAANPDMTSSAFMQLLKQNLQDAAKAEGSGGQAQAMLTALDNGTLTVSDPTAGTSITAWDVDGTSASDKAGNSATTISTSDWNDFLKAHLTRGSDGTFVRNDDGSFVDKTTGNEAYFGQVGSQFYYLSWPSASSSTGTAATDATSA